MSEPEIWTPFLSLEGNVLLVALVIARIIYIKCDSASNAPKCPLNNDVSIVQKHVVKLSKYFNNVFATGENNVGYRRHFH